MSSSREIAAVLARTHHLDGGLRVRLRIASPPDRGALQGLIDRIGFSPQPLELAALTRFEPHARRVVCASALVEGRERALGFGVIDLLDPARPAAVVVDPAYEREVTPLLRRALAMHRQAAAAA